MVVSFFFDAEFTTFMNVQNHRVTILKCHLTITHGAANITYHSPRMDYPPGKFETILRKWPFNFGVKSTFLKSFP